MIVSPGIPHLYPAPHPAVSGGLGRGRRRRQRHRTVLPLLRHAGVGEVRPGAAGRRHHRLERQVDDDGADRACAAGGGPARAGRGQHRARRARPRSGAGRDGRGARALLLPDRARPGAPARRRGVPEPLARPFRPPRRARRLFRRQAPAFHPRRPVAVDHRHRRERGTLPRQHHARGGRHGRPGDHRLGDAQGWRRRLAGPCPQGLYRRVAAWAAGRLDRPAVDGDAARRAQPPERLRRLCRGAHPRHRAASGRGGAGQLSRPRAPEPAGRDVEGRPHRQRLEGDQCRRGRKGAGELRAHPLDRRGAGEGGRDRSAPAAVPAGSEGLPDR